MIRLIDLAGPNGFGKKKGTKHNEAKTWQPQAHWTLLARVLDLKHVAVLRVSVWVVAPCPFRDPLVAPRVGRAAPETLNVGLIHQESTHVGFGRVVGRLRTSATDPTKAIKDDQPGQVTCPRRDPGPSYGDIRSLWRGVGFRSDL